jgi:hypothetical protein
VNATPFVKQFKPFFYDCNYKCKPKQIIIIKKAGHKIPVFGPAIYT